MSIQEHLNKIRNAVYGHEVRESIAKGIETAYDDASENGNANMEVTFARGTHPNLRSRLDETTAQKADKVYVDDRLETKVAKGEARLNTEIQPINVSEMDTETKQLFTGGAVAVVGENAVGTENLKNSSATSSKRTDLGDVGIVIGREYPNFNTSTRKLELKGGGRIQHKGTIYSFGDSDIEIDYGSKTSLANYIGIYFNTLSSSFNARVDADKKDEHDLLIATTYGNQKFYMVGHYTVGGVIMGTEDKAKSSFLPGLTNLWFSSTNSFELNISTQGSDSVIEIVPQLFLYALPEGNTNNKRIIFQDEEGALASGRTLPILQTGIREIDGTCTFTIPHNMALVYDYASNEIKLVNGYANILGEHVLLAFCHNGVIKGGLLNELNDHLITKRLNEHTDTEISGIVSRNKDVEHIVNASADYLRSYNYDQHLCLLVGTDFHADSKRIQNMVEYLNAMDVIDGAINIGDTMGSYFSDNNGTFYTNSISKTTKPILTTIGNHDAGNTALVGQSATVPQMYTKFIKPNETYMDLDYEIPVNQTYYYKDFTNGRDKVRVIVLNTYDLPDENNGTDFTVSRTMLGYSQSQIDWFIETLNDTPTDYQVLIAVHDQIENRIKLDDHIFTSPSRELPPKTVLMGTVISDVVNAWKNGTTLNETYELTIPTNDVEDVLVSADFTNRGEGTFICYLTGDRHVDAIYHIEKYPDQIGITFDTSNYQSLPQRNQSDLPRLEGTKSEDCLTTIAIDTTNRNINIVRIGANVTRYMKDRTMSSISY